MFDPKTFRDVASYRSAYACAEGIRYSTVNGQLVIENGTYTNQLPGKEDAGITFIG